jgi:hypothetical protein
MRLLHLCPEIPLCSARNDAPITLGTNNKLCPLVWLPAHRVHKPFLDIAFSIGHIHHQGSRTGLFDLTGALISFQPAVTLFLLHRFAFTLLGHWLFRPLPDLHPPHA